MIFSILDYFFLNTDYIIYPPGTFINTSLLFYVYMRQSLQLKSKARVLNGESWQNSHSQNLIENLDKSLQILVLQTLIMTPSIILPKYARPTLKFLVFCTFVHHPFQKIFFIIIFGFKNNKKRKYISSPKDLLFSVVSPIFIDFDGFFWQNLPLHN